MSPTGMIHPEHPAFGYPGQQEWAPVDYQAMNYYPGPAGRGYPDSLGSTGTDVEYPGQRPMSPTQQQILQQRQQQQQQQNGFNPGYNRGSFPSPSTPSTNGTENFHPFHSEKLPNHSLADTANTFPSIQQVS